MMLNKLLPKKYNYANGVSITKLLNEIIPLGIKIKNKHITELRELEDCSCENVAEIRQVFFKKECDFHEKVQCRYYRCYRYGRSTIQSSSG